MVDNCTELVYPAIHPQVIVGVKIVTGITCTFSIVGACLVIFTYVAFKDLRTTARQLLVNLCVADILVASSHFVGIIINYERFIPYYNGGYSNLSSHDPLCITQASVTMFGSIASFLWTMSIAVYFLLIITSRNKKIIKWIVVLLYLISWGLPIPFIIASGAKRFLGFELTGGLACYLVDDDDDDTDGSLVALEIFSYEVWVYIAYILLPVIYTTIFCCIRLRKTKYANSLAATKTDLKLLLIPIIFLLLRIWTTFVNAVAYYTNNHFSHEYRCSTVNAVIQFIETIGINAQGLVNAILFCFLTRQVRRQLYLTITCRRQHNQEKEELLEETGSLSLSSSTNIQGTYGSINNYTQ